jgi:heat shock protein HtpX
MLTRTLKDPRVLPLVLVVVLAAAVVLSGAALAVGLPFWVGTVVGLLLGAGGAFAVAQRGQAVLLSGLPMATPRPGELARLDNLLGGVTVGQGLAMPEVVLVDTDAVNAAVVEGTAGVTLVVTRGLVGSLTRIELEAVLAHELSLVRDGEVAVGSVLAGFAAVAPGALADRVVARMGDDQRIVRADLAGVGMTRYPPGLVAALTRLGSGSSVVPGVHRASAHLWLAQPTGTAAASSTPTHPAIETRIDTLREL